MSDTSTKHKIKQVDRYLGNSAYEARDVARGLLTNFAFVKHQRVPVAVDWTKVGPFWLMTASIVLGSRALPFYWLFIDTDKTRMADGQARFMDEVVDVLPADVELVFLFDAGFDDCSFLRHLLGSKIPVRFVARFTRSSQIRQVGKDDWINFKTYKMERGRVYDWGDVEFTKEHQLQGVRAVSIHDHDMKDPWLLVTNVNWDADVVVKMYGRRFETEETYKDYKDIRFGMQLKGSRVTTPERLLRLIMAQTIAYYTTVLCGIWGEEKLLHYQEQANTVKKRRVLSLFRLGLRLLKRGLPIAHELVPLLRKLFHSFTPQFGGAHCQRYG